MYKVQTYTVEKSIPREEIKYTDYRHTGKTMSNVVTKCVQYKQILCRDDAKRGDQM